MKGVFYELDDARSSCLEVTNCKHASLVWSNELTFSSSDWSKVIVLDRWEEDKIDYNILRLNVLIHQWRVKPLPPAYILSRAFHVSTSFLAFLKLVVCNKRKNCWTSCFKIDFIRIVLFFLIKLSVVGHLTILFN